jgi:uncharacterized protein (DUF362 family)
MKDVSRRDFLKYVGVGALGLVAGPRLVPAFERTLFPLTDASDVVQCFHEDATSGSDINEEIVQVMMDASIKALTGLNDVSEAWKSIFTGITQSSVISIKACNGNGLIPTHPEVVRCMINGLARMNVGGSSFPKNKVIVWEDHDSQLTQAGFTIYDGADPDTVRCFGTDHAGVGYDSDVTLNINGTSAHPSKILSQLSDYLINAATLRTHNLSAVTVSMKNHYGSVNARQHTNMCNPALPALSQQIRDVITPNNIQKLFVVDGLFGLYSGGPSGPPNFNPKLLLMTRDTVACDAQAQNVINEERQRQGLGALDAAFIRTAAEPPYSLGSLDINLIELYDVGVGESGRPVAVTGLFEVSPEPVRDRATVTFAVSVPGPVSLELVDATGRAKASLFSGSLDQGRHVVNWHAGRRLAGGTYFLRLNSGGATRTRKVLVLP